MKMKAYEKPTCKVVELKQRTCILAGSPNTPPKAPDYDDWLE